jgi:hypothetical protein
VVAGIVERWEPGEIVVVVDLDVTPRASVGAGDVDCGPVGRNAAAGCRTPPPQRRGCGGDCRQGERNLPDRRLR